MRSKRYLRAQLGKQAVCGKEEDMKKSEFIRFLLLPGVLASMVIASVGCSSNADEMLTAVDDFISALSEDQRARNVSHSNSISMNARANNIIETVPALLS